ncbi:MAG: YgaP-like transmembrane domain [Calditrichia bacterium]
MKNILEREYTNIGDGERKFSVVGGLGLLLLAFKKGSLGSMLAALGGLGLLYRGLTGFSRTYEVLEMDITPDQFELEEEELEFPTLTRSENMQAQRESSMNEPVKDSTGLKDENFMGVSAPPEEMPLPEKYETETDLKPAEKKPAAKNKSGKYDDMSREELYEEAKKSDISGRSRMSKQELIDALKSEQ